MRNRPTRRHSDQKRSQTESFRSTGLNWIALRPLLIGNCTALPAAPIGESSTAVCGIPIPALIVCRDRTFVIEPLATCELEQKPVL